MTDRTVDDRVRHSFAQLGGIRMHYVEWADAPEDAPLVVLLHGFPEFWYSWRHQLIALGEAGYRVIAPDLRGYGRTDKPRGIDAYQIETLANDVAELIGAVGAERACIVGHDWGGMVAWWHSMLHPQQVRTLSVLNCPHPGLQPRMMSDPAQLRRSGYMFLFQLPRFPEHQIRRNDHAYIRTMLRTDPTTPGAFSKQDVRRYVDALDPPSTKAALNYYRAYLRRGGALQDALRPIDHPTQVLWGTADRYLGTEYATPPTRWVWDVRVERIEGSSHWVQVDAAAQVNQRLLAFLPAP